MDISLTIDDRLTPGINRAVAAALDFTPAMRDIARLLETSARVRFETGTAPDGTAWKPSARAVAKGGKTLVDRGQLLGSIASDFDDSSAEVGTNLIYAAIHQFGGTITGKTRPDRTTRPLRTPFGPRASVTLPARPYLGFSADDQREIATILAEHLEAAFAGGAFFAGQA